MRKITLPTVILATYGVILIPTGLLAVWVDYTDLRNTGSTSWADVYFWLSIALEGGFLAFPVVLLFAVLVKFLWNLVAKDPSA
jgi:hypothetical protein